PAGASTPRARPSRAGRGGCGPPSGGAPTRGSGAPSDRRAPEAAHTPLARRQVVHLHGLDLRDPEHDELRDAHAGLDDERLARIRVQEDDLQLAAVAGVDEPGRVDDRDPVLRREPRARLDEAGIAVGDRDGEPGADERPLAGPELDPLARREVEPGIAAVRTRRHDRVVTQATDRQLDHAMSDVASASATR